MEYANCKVEDFGVLLGLLQARRGGFGVGFGLDHAYGEVACVTQDVVGALLLPAADQAAGDDDAAIGECALFGD